MATKKSPAHAGRKVADDEIKTAEHDALLTWLIDHLQLIGNAIHGFPQGWVTRSMDKAKPAIMSKWASVSDALDQYTKPGATVYSGPWQYGPVEFVPDELRSSVSVATDRFKSWSEVWPFVDGAGELTGEVKLVKYEVMQPVFHVVQRPMSEHKVTSAGFIDLMCTMGGPLQLKFASGIAWAWDKASPRESARSDQKLDMQSLTTLSATPADEDHVWERKDVRRKFWFTVRTGAFTLGEVLQELKTLQDLSDGKDPDPRPDRDFNPEHKVVLVVNGIDPAMRRHIEHEGFIVVDRSVFPSE